MGPFGRRSIKLVFLLVLAASVTALFTCGIEEGDDDDDDDRNGGVYFDSETGLTWQIRPPTETFNWYEAGEYCLDLKLADQNDWRLPTISELRSLIRSCPETETDGECGVIDGCLDNECWDDSCTGCPQGEGPTDGCYWPDQLDGSCGWFWSASATADSSFPAWIVFFYSGQVHNGHTYYGHYAVRCVR